MFGKLVAGTPRAAEVPLQLKEKLFPSVPLSNPDLKINEAILNKDFVNLANLIDLDDLPIEKIQIKMLEYGEELSDLEEIELNEFLSNLALSKNKLNYVKLKIGSLEFAALVDSGAARSFISLPIKEQALKLGF